MSPELISALLGALVGAFISLAGNYAARLMGSVLCEPSGFHFEEESIVAFAHPEEGYPVVVVSYSFDIDFFNGRDMPTGLRGLTVVLTSKHGSEFVSEPFDRAAEQSGDKGARYQALHVINLPPRQWVHTEFEGTFEYPLDSFEEAEEVMEKEVNPIEWKKVELVGKWPSSWRKFRKKIAER